MTLKKSVITTSKGKLISDLRADDRANKKRSGSILIKSAATNRPGTSKNRRIVYQAYEHIRKARELIADLRADDRANNPHVSPTDLIAAVEGMAQAGLHLRHYAKDKFVAMIEELKAYR